MDLHKTSAKISLKANGRDFDSIRKMAKTVLDCKEIYTESGLSALLSPNGTLFEIYSPQSCFPDYFFEHSNVVQSAKVSNLEMASADMLSLGATALCDITKVGKLLKFQHFKLADGIVFGLYEELY